MTLFSCRIVCLASQPSVHRVPVTGGTFNPAIAGIAEDFVVNKFCNGFFLVNQVIIKCFC